MTYKTILVHLHDLRRAKRLLDAAVPLARQSGWAPDRPQRVAAVCDDPGV